MGLVEDKICLDSDFLIDFLRNKKETVEWLKEYEKKVDLATTIINAFEIYHGEFKIKNNAVHIDNLLKNLNVLNLSIEIVKKAGEIATNLEKEGNIIEFRDILIAATVISNNYSLKTNNKKHFERIKGLRIV